MDLSAAKKVHENCKSLYERKYAKSFIDKKEYFIDSIEIIHRHVPEKDGFDVRFNLINSDEHYFCWATDAIRIFGFTFS